MSYIVDLALSPKDIILYMVNQENNLELTYNDVYLGEEGVLKSDDPNYTSMIRICSYVDSGWYNNEMFYYNRTNLESRFSNKKVLVDSLANYPDTKSLLPLVLSQLGVNLTEADVYNDQYDANATAVTIRIAADALTYTGSIAVSTGSFIPLSSIVTNTVLDGFSADMIER